MLGTKHSTHLHLYSTHILISFSSWPRLEVVGLFPLEPLPRSPSSSSLLQRPSTNPTGCLSGPSKSTLHGFVPDHSTNPQTATEILARVQPVSGNFGKASHQMSAIPLLMCIHTSDDGCTLIAVLTFNKPAKKPAKAASKKCGVARVLCCLCFISLLRFHILSILFRGGGQRGHVSSNNSLIFIAKEK